MFSLTKLSYCICDESERWFYDIELETLKIDVKSCCTDLLHYIKNKTDYLNNISDNKINLLCDDGKL